IRDLIVTGVQTCALPISKRGCLEWKVSFVHAAKRCVGRLCAIRKSAVATVRAQKKIRQEASKKQKQVNEEALKLAGFIVVFTSRSEERRVGKECRCRRSP